MRIGQNSRDELGEARGTNLARPVDCVIPPIFGSATERDALLSPDQGPLELLIQHPVHGRLGHAQVARAHALVQTADPFVAQHLADAVQAVLIPALGDAAALFRQVLVELEAGLDHPDGVCRCAGDDASEGRRAEVHPGGVLAVVEIVANNALAVAVRVEID